MSLDVALGTIDVQGLNINDTLAVTGLGFAPKLVMHSGVGLATLNGSGAGASRLSIGGSNGDAGHVASYKQGEGTPTQNGVRNSRDDCQLNVLRATSGLDARLDMQSLDADGYTLREIVVNSPAGAILYNALALGGENLEVATGVVTEPNASGAQVVSGLGFRPAALIFLSNALPTNGSAIDTNMSMGFVGTDLTNAVLNCAGNNAGAQSARYCRLGESLSAFNATASALEASGRVTAYGSDGFTITWDSVSAAGTNRYFFFALGGVVGDVGSLTLTATAVGQTNTVTGLTGRPELVLINSHAAAAANAAGTPEVSTTTQIANLNHGLFSSTTARRATGSLIGFQGGFGSSNPRQSDNSCLMVPSPTGGFTASTFDVDAVTGDGFRLICDQINDVQDRFTVFLSLRDAAQVYNAPHLGTD